MKRPSTEQEHRAAAERHAQAAKDAQNPSERYAHLAAAKAHREAAKDAAAGLPTDEHQAHAFAKDADEQTALRKRYGEILERSIRNRR